MEVLSSAELAPSVMQKPAVNPTANGVSVASTTPALKRHDRRGHEAEQSNSAPPTQQGSQETSSSTSSGASGPLQDHQVFSKSSQNTTSSNETFPPPSSSSSSHEPPSDRVQGCQTSFSSGLTVRPPRPITPSTEADVDDQYTTGVNSAITSPISVASSRHHYGSKRTASGTIKSGSPGYASEANNSEWRGHSKTASLDSTASKVAELSAQLKARLSYAAFKVQNGLEARNIEELEKSASPQTSPVSNIPATNPRRLVELSSGGIPYVNRQASGLSSSAAGCMTSSQPQTSPVPTRRGLNLSPEVSSWTSQYTQVKAQSGGGPVPTLAPPVDIVSKSRRSYQTQLTPNSSASRAIAGYHENTHAQSLAPPRTPTSTASRAGILRTPSQRADQEAIDTLLLLASPSNSPHFSRANGSTLPSPVRPSPLRPDWPTPGKRVAFDGAIRREQSNSSSEADSWRVRGLVQPTQSRDFVRGLVRNEHDVEKMLDAMDQAASSSDDEEILRSQHEQVRVATRTA